MQKNNSMQNSEPFNPKKPASDANSRTSNEQKGCSQTGDEKFRDPSMRGRLLQCIGNLNALYKVQGALLGQMEREIE